MTMLPNWVDLLIVTLLFTMCYMGFGHGFLAELLDVLGAVSATALTINYAGVATRWVQSFWRTQSILVSALVFWGLFLSVLYVVHLVVRAVTSAVKWERLHWSIQGCGLILGGLRGLWWAGFTVVALSLSGIAYLRESVEEHSVFGPRLLAIANASLERAAGLYPGSEYHGDVLIPPLHQETSPERSDNH